MPATREKVDRFRALNALFEAANDWTIPSPPPRCSSTD